MTVVADRDSGEQASVAEQVVDQLMWWLAGPFSEPPPSVARMTVPERQAAWAHLDQVARARGEDALRALAEELVQKRHARRGPTANGQPDPA